MIEVHHLWKTYHDSQQGEATALAGISFTAEAGKIYGLLGPNGAGKTTALRILATVLKPSRGTIVVNGYDVRHQPEHVRKQIGFVSNNTAIYDRMTAWETVAYFGRLHGLRGDTLVGRMDELFDRLQMNDIRQTLGAKMSTGMKQKVSIARALVHNPPVLVFDEATVGLDILAARALLDRIAQLRDEGKCILFSTHIMREVERLCDRVAIMHQGRFLAEGTLPELRDSYGQADFEELFFRLLETAEAGATADARDLSTSGCTAFT